MNDRAPTEADVRRMEQELNQKYLELGKMVQQMSEHKVDEINQLVDLLIEAKIRLRAISGGEQNERTK